MSYRALPPLCRRTLTPSGERTTADELTRARGSPCEKEDADKKRAKERGIENSVMPNAESEWSEKKRSAIPST